ncbi:archaellin/type IV pilin N-terminal domain-containing protein [Methanoculleus sp.]|uniref:archaellin/type IV pilin N-terminal domain-containing protein n=1 Tax=Methanoculleus sp. TaxID=90427 RepID=UPI001BD42BB6|nr:archaellin/type IV pilin N-terminal domain-containing protein [Methanoculleus sp.]
MSKLVKNEDAFTGLEAAIVLIAFIVVAAVFSYVVLGAGFFTTQKSQEVVHTGVAQTSSTLELSGPVIAQASSTTALGEVSFYLQLAAGGSAVDMKKVTYTVATEKYVSTFVDQDSDDSGTFPTVTRAFVGPQDNSDNLLDKHEMVMITVPLTGEFADAVRIQPNDRFNIDIKPDIGAALGMTKTAPAAMTTDHNYELY